MTLSFRPSPPAVAARRCASLGALPRPLPPSPDSPPRRPLRRPTGLAPRANVKFVGARVNGWPVTLVLTAATVPPGAQFLADYGKGYYQEFYAEADGAAAGAAAGEAAAEMAEMAEAGEAAGEAAAELAEAPAPAAAAGAARRPGRRAVAAPPGFYRERTQGGMVRPGPSGGRNA